MPDSDVDIMILLGMSDLELKTYSQQLSYMTYDFNLDNDLDIKPIAKSEAHFNKWVKNYPFYANVHMRRHYKTGKRTNPYNAFSKIYNVSHSPKIYNELTGK